MSTKKYPNWLVPLEIAIKLKEIGYRENCYFEFSEDNGLTLETLERESSIIEIDDLLFCTNENWQNVSVPTWTEVLAWFRERGYYGNVKFFVDDLKRKQYMFEIQNIEDSKLVEFDRNITLSYKEAQENLVLNLIKIYKEKHKNNI